MEQLEQLEQLETLHCNRKRTPLMEVANEEKRESDRNRGENKSEQTGIDSIGSDPVFAKVCSSLICVTTEA